MRAVCVMLVILVVAIFAASGCSECPIHKALFGSHEDKPAPEATDAGEQAALDMAILPPSA